MKKVYIDIVLTNKLNCYLINIAVPRYVNKQLLTRQAET